MDLPLDDQQAEHESVRDSSHSKNRAIARDTCIFVRMKYGSPTSAMQVQSEKVKAEEPTIVATKIFGTSYFSLFVPRRPFERRSTPSERTSDHLCVV